MGWRLYQCCLSCQCRSQCCCLIWRKDAPAGVQEVANRSQQFEGFIVDCNIAQRRREGYPVLKCEIVNLHKPISALAYTQCCLLRPQQRKA